MSLEIRDFFRLQILFFFNVFHAYSNFYSFFLTRQTHTHPPTPPGGMGRFYTVGILDGIGTYCREADEMGGQIGDKPVEWSFGECSDIGFNSVLGRMPSPDNDVIFTKKPYKQAKL